MNRIIKKVLFLLLVAFVGISLVSCDETTVDTTNKVVPYGSLTTNEYASVGQIKLTEKDLYDRLRVNAYDYLLDEMIKIIAPVSTLDKLIESEVLTEDEIQEKLIKIANEQCYGTSDENSLKEMNAVTKEKYENQFADQMYLLGIKNIKDNDEFHADVLNHFKDTLAQKEYVRGLLTDTSSKYYWENEFQKDSDGNVMTDEDGNEITNPYYISEETIESNYNSNFNSEAKYNVVIIEYNTLFDAENALNNYDKNVEDLEYTDFTALYNDRYAYKAGNDDKNFFLNNTELSKYNSSLVSLIKNIDANLVVEKDDQGNENIVGTKYKLYQQFGGKIYFVYVNGKVSEGDYAGIETEDDKKAAKDATVERIIENKLTSSTISSLLFEKLYDAEVVINDYVFDSLYAAENSNHTRLEAINFNNNNVATVNGTDIKVRSFYEKLEKLLGVSTAMDYFTNETLLVSDFKDKVTEDDEKEINTDFEEIMTSFNNGDFASNGLPTSVGADVFKFVYFGYTNENDIKEYYKAQKIWEYYINYQSEEYFQLAETFGKEYAGYTENDTPVEGKYFDLSVKHILLTVDYNGDGTPDDPEAFMSKLSEQQRTDYYEKLTTTMVKIIEEVNYLVDKDLTTMLKALDFVLKRYNSSGVIESSKTNETWDLYKSEFNFGLKIEDLGSVNNSTASQYVSEFSVGVQNLYRNLKADSSLSVSDEYFYGDILADNTNEQNELNVEAVINKMEENKYFIKTSYGYHILASYNSATLTSAKYTSTSDSENQYGKSIEVVLNGEKTTIDNAYSDYIYATINQIKIYEGQLNTDDGITNLPSGAKTFIGKFYSDFKTKYTNSTFRSILYAYENFVESISFDETLVGENNAEFIEFLKIQKRQFDSYATEDVNNINIFANWWNLVLPQTDKQ